jgi:protein phosphatase
MQLTIPTPSLVCLIGASGSGKSTFARRFFLPTEIVSSDACRGLVADDETDQSASAGAFAVLHSIVRERLKLRRIVVVDATNVQPESRAALVALAREHHLFAVAVVIDVPEGVCNERNALRPDRNGGAHVVRNHRAALRRTGRHLDKEGFRYVYTLRSVDEVDAAEVVRQRLWVDQQDDHGPFDVIGDVHGCYDELLALLAGLGWTVDDHRPKHPDGRKLVFVGDLTDRGPKSAEVLELVMNAVQDGVARCVCGNHDAKLARKLRGKDVKIAHGLATTLESLSARPEGFHERVRGFLDGLVSHYVLDGGRLVVAHAGLKEAFHGRSSGTVREFAMYGDTTGEIDSYGLPVRLDWAVDYRGKAAVVHGHVPVVDAEWHNHTLDVDTGCCFGGKLTALRWPERELVAVPALQVYQEPARPLDAVPARAGDPGQIDLGDVSGRRSVHTSRMGNVAIGEEQSAAALEVMSRFAVDPRWLVYLPPTMSPCATSAREGIPFTAAAPSDPASGAPSLGNPPDGRLSDAPPHTPAVAAALLEHPDEAFAYFRDVGVDTVICEEKHMGSRAVAVVCRDAAVAARKFADDGRAGVIYTRTGRPFFEDAATEAVIVGRLRDGLDAAGLWDELGTDWAVIDAELLPWSAKAQSLLRQQYAPVGVAGSLALAAAEDAVARGVAAGLPLQELRASTQDRRARVEAYRAAWRRYCWPVVSADELVIAPFHLLATEGRVHADRPHDWHRGTLARLERPGVRATAWRAVDLADPTQVADAVGWWEALVGAGGEGMVVKPMGFVERRGRKLVQPAVKCRGPEYLRLIYGPEYDRPANLARLRERGLGGKRSLALREFALGLEALDRFVAGDALWRVHEAVFAVLALETEAVDPRL